MKYDVIAGIVRTSRNGIVVGGICLGFGEDRWMGIYQEVSTVKSRN